MRPRPPKRQDIPDGEALRAVVESQWMKAGRGPLEVLVDRGWPFKVALRKLEHLADRDLLEYGTTIRFPWLTDAGCQRVDQPDIDHTDLAQLMRRPVKPCPASDFHLLPANHVRVARSYEAGGVARCERCNALIYVPAAPRYERR